MGKLHFGVHLLWFALRDRVFPPHRRVSEVGLKPGQTVLDYGFGGGSFTLAAAEQVGPEGLVLAVDADPLAVARLQRLITRRELTNIVIRQTEGKLDLPDDRVEAVLLYDVYHLLAEPEKVLAELHRVLRPGGTLSFLDHFLSDARSVAVLTAQGWFEALPRTGKTRSFRCLK